MLLLQSEYVTVKISIAQVMIKGMKIEAAVKTNNSCSLFSPVNLDFKSLNKLILILDTPICHDFLVLALNRFKLFYPQIRN